MYPAFNTSKPVTPAHMLISGHARCQHAYLPAQLEQACTQVAHRNDQPWWPAHAHAANGFQRDCSLVPLSPTLLNTIDL